DYKVTGVQTCALPIFMQQPDGHGEVDRVTVVDRDDLRCVRDGLAKAWRSFLRGEDEGAGFVHGMCGVERAACSHHGDERLLRPRSEERRVGKGCRSRE